MKKISTAHLLLIAIIILQLLIKLIIPALNLALPSTLQLSLGQLSMIIPFAVYCIVSRQNPLKLIRFKKIRIRTVLLAVLVVVFSYPVVILLNVISMLFVDNAMAKVMPQILDFGLPVGMALIAVTPAIVEEAIFRGTLYNTYSRRKPLAGIFLSAFLFGLMHMNFNQMPYAIYLGIVMALMMEASDSIVTPMIMHFTMNGVSTLISFTAMSETAGSTVSGANTADFYSILSQAYQSALSEQGLNMSEAEINQMVTSMMPKIIGQVISVLLMLTVIAIVIVGALIYLTFIANHRRPSQIFKAKHPETAFVEGRGGVMRKNRMIDIYLVVFVIYALVQCILSI